MAYCKQCKYWDAKIDKTDSIYPISSSDFMQPSTDCRFCERLSEILKMAPYKNDSFKIAVCNIELPEYVYDKYGMMIFTKSDFGCVLFKDR